ncbi:glycoside hydrolase family 16 protein [Nocardioides speluncae]|uniref:glycoside hydrolase family 16 protein n=1 Tax=Nocardioides speluncae TaxID=2670337 RepID=UPI00197EF0F9|nr:glycoside hydrolase family 16 protein [Nocardioides speluncae]
MSDLDEEFAGTDLDLSIWLPHYLPAWSSRAASAATWTVSGSCLTLSIPREQALWCADDHRPALRVSGVQTGSRSGPVGSTLGQQSFRSNQVVREEQPRFQGHLTAGGRVEIRCRMELSARSMASLWMVGFEEVPEQCGEICVFEVFGRSVADGFADVGTGVKAIRDPGLAQDFAAPSVEVDVAQFHTYAVEWTPGGPATFSVDDRPVRRAARTPVYPLQLMLAVFDFPEWTNGADDHLEPKLVVDYVRSSGSSRRRPRHRRSHAPRSA